MRTWHAVAAVIVLLIGCTVVSAEPTLNGYTGLLVIPTADTLGQGQYTVGVNSGELQDWDDWGYYATFGLGEQTEAGLLMFRTDGRTGDNTFLHIKRNLSEITDGGPNIAAGIYDLTDEIETTVYMVASWAQGNIVGEVEGRSVRFLDLHAGFAAGQLQDFFAGVDLRVGTEFTFMAEWVNDDVNIGARFSPVDNLTIDAGLLDVDDLAVNVSYTSNL